MKTIHTACEGTKIHLISNSLHLLVLHACASVENVWMCWGWTMWISIITILSSTLIHCVGKADGAAGGPGYASLPVSLSVTTKNMQFLYHWSTAFHTRKLLFQQTKHLQWLTKRRLYQQTKHLQRLTKRPKYSSQELSSTNPAWWHLFDAPHSWPCTTLATTLGFWVYIQLAVLVYTNYTVSCFIAASFSPWWHCTISTKYLKPSMHHWWRLLHLARQRRGTRTVVVTMDQWTVVYHSNSN